MSEKDLPLLQPACRCKLLFLLALTFCCVLSTPPHQASADTLRARVLFTGDIMAHQEQLDAARTPKGWDFSPQFKRIRPLFSGALVVGNFETVLGGEATPYSGYPSFNAPDQLAHDLKKAGFDVLTLANNHILDRGARGALRTLQTLEKAGIASVGVAPASDSVAPPLLVEHSGLRWVFLSYTYGSNNPHPPSGVTVNVLTDQALREGFSQAHLLKPDVIIACLHWGNEYQFVPTGQQKEVAQLCLKLGATLVIGTHPHVLQPIDVVYDKGDARLTAFSLGNFISFQRTLPRERSALLAVDVSKKEHQKRAEITRVSVAPIRVSVTRPAGKRLFQLLYAGTSPRFNHSGLAYEEVKRARQAGRSVLDYLGAAQSADESGFYTLWEREKPQQFPKSRRKSPL